MNKKNSITFRLPQELQELYSGMLEQIKKQGEEQLVHVVYYMLGMLLAHDIFKTNPELAFEVVARIRYARGPKTAVLDELFKTLSKEIVKEHAH